MKSNMHVRCFMEMRIKRSFLKLHFVLGRKVVASVYDEAGTGTVTPPADTREFVACHMGIVESTFKPVIFTGAVSDIKNIGISEPLYGGR